jgi:hypothetical protein
VLEIAGFVISGLSLLNDLFSTHKDIASWDERDLPVDRDWLAVALEERVLPGVEKDYVWASEASVATKEMRGTHTVVIAHNDARKIKYRIVRRGIPEDALVLMKKRESV